MFRDRVVRESAARMAVLRAFACAGDRRGVADGRRFRRGAGSTDACAQRVIRDWYDGGRVDGVYPLRCYRAAIRALPEDVLQYSDARIEIERALAFASRGDRDPGARPRRRPPPQRRSSVRSSQRSELATRSDGPPRSRSAPTRSERRDAPTCRCRALRRSGPLAARDDLRVADASGLPYPVVVLATLAALLVATARRGAR